MTDHKPLSDEELAELLRWYADELRGSRNLKCRRSGWSGPESELSRARICPGCAQTTLFEDCPLRSESSVLPFPPDVVERAPPSPNELRDLRNGAFQTTPTRVAEDIAIWRNGYATALSVVADYLRSDEVREWVASALDGLADEVDTAADAVISALLGEKREG